MYIKVPTKINNHTVSNLYQKITNAPVTYRHMQTASSLIITASIVMKEQNQPKTNNTQLSPEGEVNSGGYIPRREASRYNFISIALN